MNQGRRKLFNNLALVLFASAAVVALGIAVYTSALISMLFPFFRGSIESHLLAAARAAVHIATPAELRQLRSPEDMETPLYADLRARMIKFAKENNIVYVYYYIINDDETVQPIVDNDETEDSYTLASDPLPIEEQLVEAAATRSAVTTLVGEYSAGYDGLLTAYAPVFDENGEVHFIAGVDTGDELLIFVKRRFNTLLVLLIASVVCTIASGMISFFIFKRNEAGFSRRLAQQKLMAQLAGGFISTEDTTNLITGALRMTGEFLDVDRALIGIAEADSETSHAAYVWSKSPQTVTAPDTVGLNALIISSFPLWQPEVIPTISCNDVKKQQRYAILETVGIESFIWAPVYVENRFWAILSIEGFSVRQWTEGDCQLVSTVSSVIAGAVNRDLREKERDAAYLAAERASKAKSDFLANMSHEMRTPMNAIIGMTSIAENSYDIEKKEYCLEKIKSASTHLLGVINDVLDMSKIEANKFELSPVDFNFEKNLQKVVNVINFKVDEKKLLFSVHIDRHIPHTLHGDDQRLAQVITNLLSNAVKFTPEGGSIRLEAALAEKKDELCTLKISVTDSGIGISEEQQAKLFASFVQADSSTSRRFGGTGLGLAISKHIVEMMDGVISVNSEPGKGSVFTFTVKLQERPDVSEETQSPVDWNMLRVLVVDDDPDIREWFVEIANRLKFKCEAAGSGSEALELLQKNGPFDIYFVDWKMPDLDGIELSSKITSLDSPASPSQKIQPVIIMMSSAEWNNIESDAKKAGVLNFIPKPLFPSTVADCISRSLGVARQITATAQGAAPQTDGLVRYDGKRIILAEDVDINREIVVTLLEPTGATIVCAENGAEAVRLYKEAPESCDMIFMDVQMPEMDGYEATRVIRKFEMERLQSSDSAAGENQRSPRKQVPIIAMTANVFREDVERCISAGMNDHVGKPLDMGEVLEKMRQYL